MAATARTVWSVVRPHVPSIRFPSRNIKQSDFKPAGATVANSTVSSQQSTSPPADSKPIGYTPRGSGIEYIDLPPKYRRLEISQEEIEYIERGGPL